MTTDPATPDEQSRWFYADASNQPQGPVTFAELQHLAQKGGIAPATPVIQEGGKEWVTYSSIIVAAAPAPAPTREPWQESVLPIDDAKPGIAGWLGGWNKQSVWVVLIVVAALCKIGAHIITGGSNAAPASSAPVARESKTPTTVSATPSIPPLLKAQPLQVDQARRASRMKVLPISPPTLKRRLSEALEAFKVSYKVPDFSITTEGEKDGFKARVGSFELLGGVDRPSGKLADLTISGAADVADDEIVFTALVIECIAPNQFIRGELVGQMRRLVKEAATVPGNGMTTVIESDERGFRINALIDPDTRKVFISIEPTEIYVHLN